MSDEAAQSIRSYQRIFSPERRVYAIDGRRLPVPGGVPLEWVGWAFGVLVLVLVLSGRSVAFAVLTGVAAGFLSAGARRWRSVAVAAVGGFVAVELAGVVLDWVDWPLRLVIVPGAIATLARQPSPDGRPAYRHAVSRLCLYARASSRTLDRPLREGGAARVWAPAVWVAPDARSAVLHHGRVTGPARLVFARPVVAVPGRGRLVVRRAEGHRVRDGERLAEVIELGAGQVVEVRP